MLSSLQVQGVILNIRLLGQNRRLIVHIICSDAKNDLIVTPLEPLGLELKLVCNVVAADGRRTAQNLERKYLYLVSVWPA